MPYKTKKNKIEDFGSADVINAKTKAQTITEIILNKAIYLMFTMLSISDCFKPKSDNFGSGEYRVIQSNESFIIYSKDSCGESSFV